MLQHDRDKAKIRESKIETDVCDYARGLGCLALKLTSPGNRGVPDRILIYQGQVRFIEFKAPGKNPTWVQKEMANRIRLQGLQVDVVDSIPKGHQLVDRMVDRHKEDIRVGTC